MAIDTGLKFKTLSLSICVCILGRYYLFIFLFQKQQIQRNRKPRTVIMATNINNYNFIRFVCFKFLYRNIES